MLLGAETASSHRPSPLLMGCRGPWESAHLTGGTGSGQTRRND